MRIGSQLDVSSEDGPSTKITTAEVEFLTASSEGGRTSRPTSVSDDADLTPRLDDTRERGPPPTTRGFDKIRGPTGEQSEGRITRPEIPVDSSDRGTALFADGESKAEERHADLSGRTDDAETIGRTAKYDWATYMPKIVDLYSKGNSIPKILFMTQDSERGFTPTLRALYAKLRAEGYPTEDLERAAQMPERVRGNSRRESYSRYDNNESEQERKGRTLAQIIEHEKLTGSARESVSEKGPTKQDDSEATRDPDLSHRPEELSPEVAILAQSQPPRTVSGGATHNYEKYKQQTGLPSGAGPTLYQRTNSNITSSFPDSVNNDQELSMWSAWFWDDTKKRYHRYRADANGQWEYEYVNGKSYVPASPTSERASDRIKSAGDHKEEGKETAEHSTKGSIPVTPLHSRSGIRPVPQSRSVRTEDNFTTGKFATGDHEDWNSDEGDAVRPHRYEDSLDENVTSINPTSGLRPTTPILQIPEYEEPASGDREVDEDPISVDIAQRMEPGSPGSQVSESGQPMSEDSAANEREAWMARQREEKGRLRRLRLDIAQKRTISQSFRSDTDDEYDGGSRYPKLSEDFSAHLKSLDLTSGEINNKHEGGTDYSYAVSVKAAHQARAISSDTESIDSGRSGASSIASVADSIFSFLSNSSMSSVAGPQSAVDRLVALLLGDTVVKSLCVNALAAVERERFERNLRRLLKEFAVGLRQEAETTPQRRAAHFVRIRARNSAYMICNKLNKKTTITKAPKPADHEPEHEYVSDESDGDRSDEEVDDLQQLESFIKSSEALKTLRDSLRIFAENKTSRPTTKFDVPGPPIASQALSEVPKVEQDVASAFKAFAAQQRKNVKDMRLARTQNEKEIKLNDLKQFADSFQLNTPVPQDLVSIIAKDLTKQQQIQEKEWSVTTEYNVIRGLIHAPGSELDAGHEPYASDIKVPADEAIFQLNDYSAESEVAERLVKEPSRFGDEKHKLNKEPSTFDDEKHKLSPPVVQRFMPLMSRICADIGNNIKDMIIPGQPIPAGMTRIRFKCQCGHRLIDDVRELVPGGADRLQQQLSQSTQATSSSFSSASDSSSGTLSSLLHSLSSLLNSGSSKNLSPDLPMHDIRPPIVPAESDNSEPQLPPAALLDLIYLLICYNKGKFEQRLLQLDLTKLEGQSDKALFLILRSNYYSLRSRWTQLFSLRVLESINFVHFEMYKSELVDIKRRDELPPPTEKDYRYTPAPAETVPPVGNNYMMHVFQNPDCAEDEPLCLSRFPKKLKEKLLCRGGIKPGWGLQFIEGWDVRKLWLIGFVFFGVGSLTLGIVWAVMKHSIQDAFALAAYVVAFGMITLGTVQAFMVV